MFEYHVIEMAESQTDMLSRVHHTAWMAVVINFSGKLTVYTSCYA